MKNCSITPTVASDHYFLEIEAQDFAEFEGHMRQYRTDEAFREKMKGYTDLWMTGHREILQVAE